MACTAGQGEVESCSLTDFSESPDPAAVLLDDAMGRRQIHSRAFKFLLPVQSMKDSKQLAGIAPIEARRVVPNEVDNRGRVDEIGRYGLSLRSGHALG
jgi:hypothetical protein